MYRSQTIVAALLVGAGLTLSGCWEAESSTTGGSEGADSSAESEEGRCELFAERAYEACMGEGEDREDDGGDREDREDDGGDREDREDDGGDREDREDDGEDREDGR